MLETIWKSVDSKRGRRSFIMKCTLNCSLRSMQDNYFYISRSVPLYFSALTKRKGNGSNKNVLKISASGSLNSLPNVLRTNSGKLRRLRKTAEGQ